MYFLSSQVQSIRVSVVFLLSTAQCSGVSLVCTVLTCLLNCIFHCIKLCTALYCVDCTVDCTVDYTVDCTVQHKLRPFLSLAVQCETLSYCYCTGWQYCLIGQSYSISSYPSYLNTVLQFIVPNCSEVRGIAHPFYITGYWRDGQLPWAREAIPAFSSITQLAFVTYILNLI